MQTLLDLAETYNIYHTKIYKGSAKSEVFIYIYINTARSPVPLGVLVDTHMVSISKSYLACLAG